MAYMFNNGVVFTMDGVRLLISMLNQGALHKNAYKDEPDKEKVKSFIEARRQLCYDVFNTLESEYVKQKQLLCGEANGGAPLFNADQDGAKDMMEPAGEIEAIEAKHALERSLKRKAMEDDYETAARLKRKAMVDDYDTEAMLRRKAMEDDPLKKSKYELELAQTQLATEKVKREAAALAAKPAKAHRKARRPPLAAAFVNKPPQPPLAEACVDEPPLAASGVNKPLAASGVNKPPAASGVDEPIARWWPRLPRASVWQTLSYEQKLEARRVHHMSVTALQELGVVPMLTAAAISRAAAARKAYQDYLAAKKLFDESPLVAAYADKAAAADAACRKAVKRVPPILDPRRTAYCDQCPRHGGGVCFNHRLDFDARTQDPAEIYASAGR